MAIKVKAVERNVSLTASSLLTLDRLKARLSSVLAYSQP